MKIGLLDFSIFGPIIFLVVFLLILGVSHYFRKKNVLLRTLNKAKTVPIHRVKENEYSKITGKAKLVKESLIAPLSGRSCVFYQVLVEQKRGKNGWQKIINETITQDFFVESRGEMAVVKLKQSGVHKNVYLDKDHNLKSGTFKDTDHRAEAYLKRHGIKSTNILGWNKSLRYSEGIIAADEQLVVMGVGNWVRLKEPIAGFNYSKVLTLKGEKDQKLLITDLKKSLDQSAATF